MAVTIPSAMSSTWVSVRVCSPEPKIGSGRWPASTLRIRSGTVWAMPGSSSGISPGPVGVEGPADREGQLVLVVQGAAVHLARELGEAVGRARRRAVAQVLLGGGELRGPLEHHRRRHVDQPLDLSLQRGPEHRVVEAVVDLEQRVGQAVEVADAAHDRRQVDHVASSRARPRAPRRARAGRRCAPRRPRASRPAPRAGRRRAPPAPSRTSRLHHRARRSCRRRR